jgi:hypothetical protein
VIDIHLSYLEQLPLFPHSFVRHKCKDGIQINVFYFPSEPKSNFFLFWFLTRFRVRIHDIKFVEFAVKSEGALFSNLVNRN